MDDDDAIADEVVVGGGFGDDDGGDYAGEPRLDEVDSKTKEIAVIDDYPTLDSVSSIKY